MSDIERLTENNDIKKNKAKIFLKSLFKVGIEDRATTYLIFDY